MVSIGAHRRYAAILFQRFGLAPFREVLPPDLFAAAAREADCTPKRNRPLIPEVVAWLMMYVGLQTTSMTQGLCRAWGLVRAVCPSLHEGCVSEEAFCQARKQLTIGFWRNLWERVVSRFEAKFAASMLWKNTLSKTSVPIHPQAFRVTESRNGKSPITRHARSRHRPSTQRDGEIPMYITVISPVRTNQQMLYRIHPSTPERARV